MQKVMWVKFGWSDEYQGGPVDGNYSWMTKKDGEAHEAFNFFPSPDGSYCCYLPPHGKSNASPSSNDPHGWLVICLAKRKEGKGVHVVGWFKNATLNGQELPRPEYKAKKGFRLDNKGKPFCYDISAPKCFMVPTECRTKPFSHKSIGRGSYSYLLRSGQTTPENSFKKAVLDFLLSELERLRPVAIEQPTAKIKKDSVEDGTNPLGSFGTPEHRREVEMAAEQAVTTELETMGYRVIRRSDEKIGYDLQAVPLDGGRDLYVEVKGTSGSERRFYMTPNERLFMEQNGWRLAIVVCALDSPEVTILKKGEVEKCFSLQPMVWIGREVKSLD